MKNLKVNKVLVTLGMALGVTLVSSCGKNVEDKEVIHNNVHTHLYITVGDETIVFKECEGYKIDTFQNTYRSTVSYEISTSTDGILFDGKTNNYNLIYTDHSNTDSIEEFIEANENVKVYTLEK